MKIKELKLTTNVPDYITFRLSVSPFFPLLSENAYKEITSIRSNREVCGVIRDQEFIRLKNYSNHFEVGLIDQAEIKERDILFHTHASENSDPKFSKRDILTGIKNKIPLLLYHPVFNQFDFWSPDIPHPYPLKLSKKSLEIDDFRNLPYQWIRSDCYTFCRDVSQALFKKTLPNIYTRQQTIASLKYFFLNPHKLGFYKLSNFREGCFVLLKISPNIPFHMGIITKVYENGNIMMLHQIGDNITSDLINLRELMGNIIGIYDYNEKFENTILLDSDSKKII